MDEATVASMVRLLATAGYEVTRRGGPVPVATARMIPVVTGVVLDLYGRELLQGSTRTALSHREAAMLAHLVERRGRACSRDELLADVWGMDFQPGTNMVDVCVYRLRSKLVRDDVIETVIGVGYRLANS